MSLIPSDYTSNHLVPASLGDFPREVLDHIFAIFLRSVPGDSTLKHVSNNFYEIYWNTIWRLYPPSPDIKNALSLPYNIRFSQPFNRKVVHTKQLLWGIQPTPNLRFLYGDSTGNRYFCSAIELFVFSSDGQCHIEPLGGRVVSCHRYKDELLIVCPQEIRVYTFDKEKFLKLKSTFFPFADDEDDDRFGLDICMINASAIYQDKLLLTIEGTDIPNPIIAYDLTAKKLEGAGTPINASKTNVYNPALQGIYFSGRNLYLLDHEYKRSPEGGAIFYKQHRLLPVTITIQEDNTISLLPDGAPLVAGELGSDLKTDQSPCGRWLVEYSGDYVQVIDLHSGTEWISKEKRIHSPKFTDMLFLDDHFLFISRATPFGFENLAIYLPEKRDVTCQLGLKLKSKTPTLSFSFDHEKKVVHHFTYQSDSRQKYIYEQFSFEEAPQVVEVTPEEEIIPTPPQPTAMFQPIIEKREPPKTENVLFAKEPLQMAPEGSVKTVDQIEETSTQSKEMSISTIALLAIATAAVIAITLVGILAAIGNQTWAPEALKNFAHQFGPHYVPYLLIASTPTYLIILGLGKFISSNFNLSKINKSEV